MISVDELVQFALEKGNFRNDKEELEHLRSTKEILRCELLTCYEFLENKGLLEEFKNFRG